MRVQPFDTWLQWGFELDLQQLEQYEQQLRLAPRPEDKIYDY